MSGSLRDDAGTASLLPAPVLESDAARVEVSPAARWVGLSAFALSLVGVGLSTFMTIAHFTEASILACSGRGELSCTAVTTSPQSRVFGIPVALLGLGFFIVMSVLSSPPVWRRGARWLALSRTALAATGLLFVFWLIAAEVLIIGHVCLWCTGVHVVMITLGLVLTRATPAQLGLRVEESGDLDRP
jgi:uncharacterized membrane protein